DAGDQERAILAVGGCQIRTNLVAFTEERMTGSAVLLKQFFAGGGTARTLAEQMKHAVDPGHSLSRRRSADLAPMFRYQLFDFALVVLDSAAELIEWNIRRRNPSRVYCLEKSQSGTRPAK